MLSFRTTSALVIISLLMACHARPTLVHTRKLINKEIGKQKGTFAVAFRDLSTGDELFIREKEVFHAASTMKTPVMIEVYKQVSEGKFSLSDSVTVKNEFISIVDGSAFKLKPEDDSELELYGCLGEKVTFSDLVYRMITVSSNLATNEVIERVDAKKVTQTMRDLGANDILVLRGVEDSLAHAKGLDNVVTAYDLMLVFQKLAKGEAVSPPASQAMIDVLFNQKFNEIIPGKLPKGVRVAHKTGSFKGVHHDSGIVFLPDGHTYVVVILSKGLVDEQGATEAMSRVSELLYKHVVSGY